MATITTRPYRHGDEKEIVRLLKLVFGEWPPFDIDAGRYWAWKYEKNPIESNFTVIAEADKKIVGCMHGIPQIIKIGNYQYLSVHGMDVAVHPEYRRLGIYNKMSTLQEQIEAAKSVNFHYGATGNPILIKKYQQRGDFFLPQQPKLYIKIRNLELHEKNTKEISPVKKIGYTTLKHLSRGRKMFSRPLDNHRISIKQTRSFGEKFHELWQHISPNYDFIVKRDIDYMNWRYCDPMNPRYIVFQAIIDDHLQGYCVVSINNSNKEYLRGYIVDLLFRLDCPEVGYRLFSYADEFFMKNDVNVIQCLSFAGPLFKRIAAYYGYVDSRSSFMLNINRDTVNARAQQIIKNSQPEKLHFVYGDSDWI